MSRLFGAGALAAIALFMLTGFLGSDLDRDAPASLAAFALVVGLPAIGAVLLARGYLRDRGGQTARKELLRQQTIESGILRLAIASEGRLTAVEVAAQLALTPEGATEALDRLALRGQAEYEVTDDGVIVYGFRDIRNLGGKDTARGVLDA
ncbi:MAG TPA: hypothetical protein VFN22_12620 [Gemmatimonadales bacterium]|nr:hypothetical protein [Gemmatimonadales bacterium]